MRQPRLLSLALLIALGSMSMSTAQTVITPNRPMDDLTYDIEQERLLREDQLKSDSDKEAFSKRVDQADGKKTITITPEDLLQEPQLLIQLVQQAIREENIPLLKALYPVYRRLPLNMQDEFTAVYGYALVSLSERNFKEAIRSFRYLLERDPELTLIEYRLAQTLFMDKQYTDAKKIFVKTRDNEQYHPQVRQQANAFVNEIDERTKVQLSAGGNFIRDDNLNSGGGKAGGWSSPEPETGNGIAYSFSLGKDFNISGNHYLRLNTTLYGQYYFDKHEFNDTVARVYFGYGYEDFSKSIYLTPFYEKRWYGKKPYTHGFGVRLSYNQLLSPQFRLMNNVEYQRKNYSYGRDHLAADLYSFNTTLMYAQSAKQFFFGGFGWNKEDANSKANSYIRRSVRVGWGRQWDYNISTNIQGSYAEKDYGGPLFIFDTAHNKEYSLNFSIWKRDIELWGMTPKLSVSWNKTDSNLFLHRYDRTRFFIDVSKNF